MDPNWNPDSTSRGSFNTSPASKEHPCEHSKLTYCELVETAERVINNKVSGPWGYGVNTYDEGKTLAGITISTSTNHVSGCIFRRMPEKPNITRLQELGDGL